MLSNLSVLPWARTAFTLADRNGQSRKPSRSRATNQSAKVAGLALVAMWPDRLGFSVLLFVASVGTTSEVARRFFSASFARRSFLKRSVFSRTASASGSYGDGAFSWLLWADTKKPTIVSSPRAL